MRKLSGTLLSVVLVAGCGARVEVTDVEQLLTEHYLDPLAAAGIPAEVADTCRYAGPAGDERWHLSVELRVPAGQSRVAAVLVEEGAVVRQDRQPMIVQQFRGRPEDGWNGALSPAGDAASVLGLVFNNASHSSAPAALGWSEVCPESPAGSPTK